jgi:hypothetical protein
VQTVYLRPASPTVVHVDLQVDSVALELDDDGTLGDFRLELGHGFDILWLLPIEPNGRLRLVRTDNAVYSVDEPELREDPCAVDYAETWRGELARVGAGESRVLELVSIELTSSPPTYRVHVLQRDAGSGHTTSYALAFG